MKKLFPAILALCVSTMMAKDSSTKTTWFTGEAQHEGFPLLLRFPQKPDFEALQKKFPCLAVVRHQLDEVTESGLPEPVYNRTLAELDHALINAFTDGVPALVETFGGKRTYYIYISTAAKIEDAKRSIAEKFPTAKLDWQAKDDPNWQFIRRYSAEHRFYGDPPEPPR